MNWNGLKTEKGTEVDVHFEDLDTQTFVEVESSKMGLSEPEIVKAMCEHIIEDDDGIHDTGPDTKVHLMVNNQFGHFYMNDAEFQVWQVSPNWNHQSDGELLADVLGGVIGDIISDSILHSLQRPTQHKLDFTAFTTIKGTKILVEMEDEKSIVDKLQLLTQDELQTNLRNAIHDWDNKDNSLDTDGGNPIHVLINSFMNVIDIQTDDQFISWNSSENKDWKHPVPPTETQVAKYEGKKHAQRIDMAARIENRCDFCLSTTCRGRSMSFNQEGFDTVLAETEAEFA